MWRSPLIPRWCLGYAWLVFLHRFGSRWVKIRDAIVACLVEIPELCWISFRRSSSHHPGIANVCAYGAMTLPNANNAWCWSNFACLGDLVISGHNLWIDLVLDAMKMLGSDTRFISFLLITVICHKCALCMIHGSHGQSLSVHYLKIFLIPFLRIVQMWFNGRFHCRVLRNPLYEDLCT